MTDKYQKLIDNFIHWGKSANQLFAAFVVGSQARGDHQADEYSDLDIVLLVDDPAYFLSTDHWLHCIGSYHISFIEDTILDEKERRVLFDDALDVDFVILQRNKANVLINDHAAMLHRGYIFLIDKIGLRDSMPQPASAGQFYIFPTEQQFTNTISNFWYHSLWTAKKIIRGELWTAKHCMDSELKGHLLSMIECHAHANHGAEYDTWHNGRFIEEWAERHIVERLSSCFSHYNTDDTKAALLSIMDLFRSVATEAAEKLNYPYPTAADAYSTAKVTAIL